MSSIKVNGIVYHSNKITISDSRIFINGQDITPEIKTIEILIVDNLSKDSE